MKLPNKLPEKYASCFSDFVAVAKAHKLPLDFITITVGEGLHFEFQTRTPLSQQECSQLFGDFLSSYPTCTIAFSTREATAMEQMGHPLARLSGTNIRVKTNV
jgi:hypothetical protein